MARSSMERRSRSRSIDELRHDLREADEQRFYLESALNGAASEWLRACNAPPSVRTTHSITTHPIAKIAALCAVAGLFLAAGVAWPQLRALDRDRNAPTVLPKPPSTPEALGPLLVETPASLRSPWRSIPPTTTTRAHSPKVKRHNPIGRHPVTRRVAPRPLSPAEFGRHASPVS
jgi:hypothetical protein